VTIETKTVRGIEVHHVQPRGPVSWDPAWAVVDGRLVVAATFLGLKFQISRGGKKSLAELPAVAARLKAGPMTLTYQDTRAAIRQMYTAIQTFGPVLVGQLSAQGIDVELPTLPDLETIEPHILPRIDTTRRTSTGLESESHSTVPLASVSVGSPAAAGVLVALLLPAVQQAREAARRNQAMNQLKQIALAMQNYHDVSRKFPPAATCDADGKPLLSWRVKILPYLDEAALYNEFHLDEPWDSEHNKPLIALMPSIFESPNGKPLAKGETRYVVPVGKDTVFDGDKGITLGKITDGLSNTILILEVGEDKAVTWTKPDDMDFDPQKPLAGLGTIVDGGILAAFADGHVQSIRKSVDTDTLRRLILRNDGEAVDPSKY
jgi:type II secretory pathway pseudopilin PulG